MYDVQKIYDAIVRLKTADGEDVNQWDTKLPRVSDFGELLRCECVPIMQFTGLKDNNGREIYEGDILNIFMDGIPFHVVKHEALDGGYYGWNVNDVWITEVIGNIHENPELLNQSSNKNPLP